MKPSLRVAIVEDEPLARDRLRSGIALFSELLLVGEACDGRSAISLIDDLDPDMVILDVRLPECSGIEAIRRAKRPPEIIVFTTAFDNYAIAAFELGALDYLLKPFSDERFKIAIDRILRRAPVHSSVPIDQRITQDERSGCLRRFFVRNGSGIVPVRVEEITYLHAEDDYTAVHVQGKRHLVHLPLREFEHRLNRESFVRVHRSVIVNLTHVISATTKDRRMVMKMRDGSEITTSRVGLRALRERQL